ncbi:DUF4251 domain-containing protein [Allomuricauda sp. NBRC 101325]|uniref:DUF4251 domain-containing protein n=1 Tax=Allomuricauda sp. NBRC 101325 TaxID=1113758 RepID=UPI00249FB417|nr:DUF4251 domain-containing protein [Muricauda sp. NBRC 101325]GLU44724.1 hypothetical protein Musp01_23480 [Muricauda sp. NBRC 101325]
MRAFFKIGFIASFLFFAACASTSNTSATPEELAAFEKMVANQQFEINATWAQPMATQSLNSIANAGLLPPGSTANRIDITGTGGYLRMWDGKVKADLPFFGERRMGGTYSSDKVGIKFDGEPTDLTFEPAKKGSGYTVKFNITEGAESYQVVANIYPNQSARLMVASSQRTNIWYQGNLSEYTPE